MLIEGNFKEAARERKICEVRDREGHQRLVEPYMVYISCTWKKLFHCYQLKGYSKSGRSEGWKNLEISSLSEVRATDRSFSLRPEYNPFDYRTFPMVNFSLPTHDGRRR